MWRRRVWLNLVLAAAALGWLPRGFAWQTPEIASLSIRASNVAALRKQVGHEVRVNGRVARTGQSSSGMQFLNFADSELTVVCRPEDVAKFPAGGPAEQYRGQDIEITGSIELYRGKVQMRLREPAQIKIRVQRQTPEAKRGSREDRQQNAARFALRQVDTDVWVSPAGLRYQGHDPAGLTRVEHIRRHLADIPTRDGPHGVFDDGGDGDAAFALIDEAWKLAHERRLRPATDGARSSYTVDMGRRVGFLGGRAGAAQNYPALSRVLIVFETDTTNIVTAFPK
jgi:hypothetical protein